MTNKPFFVFRKGLFVIKTPFFIIEKGVFMTETPFLAFNNP